MLDFVFETADLEVTHHIPTSRVQLPDTSTVRAVHRVEHWDAERHSQWTGSLTVNRNKDTY